ncbi:hypothetical protein [Prosthecodimorpha staleyi]|uniref:Uncharacterized protein n=1 Tax=Prosthecodimorpha staleyi TaxID=2840188 RepID=A0A947D3D9_9HYPH|nr:hypothetical protein [Prosthecodimorpha staleyi]MBT9288851.1 hypothetical protein [Prosthecodimorpha staleyi]
MATGGVNSGRPPGPVAIETSAPKGPDTTGVPTQRYQGDRFLSVQRASFLGSAVLGAVATLGGRFLSQAPPSTGPTVLPQGPSGSSSDPDAGKPSGLAYRGTVMDGIEKQFQTLDPVAQKVKQVGDTASEIVDALPVPKGAQKLFKVANRTTTFTGLAPVLLSGLYAAASTSNAVGTHAHLRNLAKPTDEDLRINASVQQQARDARQLFKDRTIDYVGERFQEIGVTLPFDKL